VTYVISNIEACAALIKQFGRRLGVLILDLDPLVEARMRASLDWIDQGAAFARSYRVDKEVSGLVLATAFGRLLDPVEYGELLRRLAGGPRKR